MNSGDKIQVIIPKWRISKVENIIKEGSFYVLENFEILPNNDAYPPTKHPYVLKFHECTAVRPSGILNIPHYIFNFVNFSELASNADYSLRVFARLSCPREILRVEPSRGVTAVRQLNHEDERLRVDRLC
ncbi:replication factor-a protein 1 family protein [Striga asiatica]|uniref:Replication factor-a protein 1 family protein n=1 Tax=Striga asiatica TaxID=4170 RepID=A0A5A7QA47_STRAF|nr:replication factor-a protein 1 family protein [Striga asiatica]